MLQYDDEPFLVSKLETLISFLNENQSLWANEILYAYPNSKLGFKDSWISFLSGLDVRGLYSFQVGGAIPGLPKDLEVLRSRVAELEYLDSLDEYPSDMQSLAYQFMTAKKKHEISQVIGFLKGQSLLPADGHIVDFCGGAGYLGRILAAYYDSQTISVDFDAELQERGLLRAEKLHLGIGGSLKFVKADLLSDLEELTCTLPERSSTLGIHTCAHLSDKQFELSLKLKSKWIFNVSCCYFKTEDINYSYSKVAKDSGFKLSKESLLVAARGHDSDFESFEYSIHVKTYRYLLHMYMKDVLGLDFVSMGGLSKFDYDKTFSEYAHLRLQSVLGLSVRVEELCAFEEDKENQLKLKEMIACNSFRTLFSRLIEKYIALDRAVYLSEQSYKVKLLEVFKAQISPRNIAVFAQAR